LFHVVNCVVKRKAPYSILHKKIQTCCIKLNINSACFENNC
jgi:hypothetical protein